jgi:molybdate transport system substrate-binding protein
VFAAHVTVEVLEKIGAAFTRKTGTPVQVTGGGSPALADKILSGASADLFVAASRGVLTELLRAGMVNEDSSFLWATNSLVVVGSPGAEPPRSLQEIAAGRFRRIALPNPESTVPGPFIRQALNSAGIWEEVRARMIPTPDADKALAMVGAGEADLAIVFATDARRRSGARAVLSLPQSSHPTIPYPVVLVAHPGASPFARPFLDFLRSSQARTLLEEAGFTPAFP